MLHLVIRQHLEDFLRAAANRADGAALPEFIAREFGEFLTCGVLAHGSCPGALRELCARAPGAVFV